jgi:small subunit ribosomal protein S16
MAVKIRMTRMGRRHRPFFRINAVESKTPRDGRIIEKLGHYDPIVRDIDKQIVLDRDRVQHWLDQGAVPSDAVSQILKRHGFVTKHYDKKMVRRARAKAIARAAGKPFDEAERIAAQKAAEKAAQEEEDRKKAEEEKAKAEAEAAKAAEEEAAQAAQAQEAEGDKADETEAKEE